MFGYVKVNKPEMKVREYETYRGLYCSLCRTLGKEYGITARFMLSYDVTFLVIVLLATRQHLPSFKKGRCPFNPLKRCNYCQNGEEEFSFAAAVTVLLFYYKIKDNIQDSGFFKKILFYLIYPYAYFKRKKALKKYKELDGQIGEAMIKQAQVEKSETDSFDISAHNSADMLGKIFSWDNEDNEKLYKFGYFIGRWVYLVDAADDIENDIKSGSFNVFINKFSLSKDRVVSGKEKEEIRGSLNMSLSSAAAAYKELDISILFPIIENIIFDSMYNIMNDVLKGKNSDEGSL